MRRGRSDSAFLDASLVLIWAGALAATAWFTGAALTTMLVSAPLILLVVGHRVRGWRRERAQRGVAELVMRLAARLGESAGGPPPDFSGLPALLARVSDAVDRGAAGRGIELANLRSVLDAVDSPVVATGAAGEVILANRAAAEFFGARLAPSGTSIEDLFTQAEVPAQHRSALSGTPGDTEIRVARPGGMRTYEVRTFPVAIRSPLHGAPAAGVPETGVVVSMRDVTELALAVQLKTDFVANASHELRTPLSSIKAAIETISETARDDPAMRDRLAQIIQSNVIRLEDLVADLLDLSRLESVEAPVRIENAPAGAIADELAEMFRAVCRERRLTLTFDLDPRLARLRSDPKLLMLILKNLIDNATKYAYEGAGVRVVGEVDETRRLIRAGSPACLARFRVIDRGVGIPIGQQQRIFERFFQVDPSRSGAAARRGTGLGLAIVKHAVKALGGTIGVESVWKEGTTMTVELPGSVELSDRQPERERGLARG